LSRTPSPGAAGRRRVFKDATCRPPFVAGRRTHLAKIPHCTVLYRNHPRPGLFGANRPGARPVRSGRRSWLRRCVSPLCSTIGGAGGQRGRLLVLSRASGRRRRQRLPGLIFMRRQWPPCLERATRGLRGSGGARLRAARSGSRVRVTAIRLNFATARSSTKVQLPCPLEQKRRGRSPSPHTARAVALRFARRRPCRPGVGATRRQRSAAYAAFAPRWRACSGLRQRPAGLALAAGSRAPAARVGRVRFAA
jgi:hypothetical protein